MKKKLVPILLIMVMVMPIFASAGIPKVKLTPSKTRWVCYSKTTAITGRVSYAGGQIVVLYNTKGKPVGYQKMPTTGRSADFSITTPTLKKGKSTIFYLKSLKSKYSKQSSTKAIVVTYTDANTGGGIAGTAERLSWPLGTSKSKYDRKLGGKGYGNWAKVYKKWHPGWTNSSNGDTRYGSCCCHSAATIVSEAIGRSVSGFLPNVGTNAEAKASIQRSLGKKFTCFVYNGNPGTLRRGDILSYSNNGPGGHVQIYLGNGKVAEGSRTNSYYPRITKNLEKSNANKEYYIVSRLK